MRDTNDVKYEFKFDHVLILVSASVDRKWKTDAGAVALIDTDTASVINPDEEENKHLHDCM